MYEQDILIRKHPERLSDIQATRTINSHDTLYANWGSLTVQQFMYCKYDVQLASLSITVSNRYVEYRVLNCVTILLLLLLFSIYIYIILLLSNLFIFIYNSVLKKKKGLSYSFSPVKTWRRIDSFYSGMSYRKQYFRSFTAWLRLSGLSDASFSFFFFIPAL